VQPNGVVHAVAEETDVAFARALQTDDACFLVG
jgi:hypothetical protein